MREGHRKADGRSGGEDHRHSGASEETAHRRRRGTGKRPIKADETRPTQAPISTCAASTIASGDRPGATPVAWTSRRRASRRKHSPRLPRRSRGHNPPSRRARMVTTSSGGRSDRCEGVTAVVSPTISGRAPSKNTRQTWTSAVRGRSGLFRPGPQQGRRRTRRWHCGRAAVCRRRAQGSGCSMEAET